MHRTFKRKGKYSVKECYIALYSLTRVLHRTFKNNIHFSQFSLMGSSVIGQIRQRTVKGSLLKKLY